MLEELRRERADVDEEKVRRPGAAFTEGVRPGRDERTDACFSSLDDSCERSIAGLWMTHPHQPTTHMDDTSASTHLPTEQVRAFVWQACDARAARTRRRFAPGGALAQLSPQLRDEVAFFFHPYPFPLIDSATTITNVFPIQYQIMRKNKDPRGGAISVDPSRVVPR